MIETDRPAIEGKVVDKNGKPLANLPVAVCGTDKPSWGQTSCAFEDKGHTSEKGLFQFPEKSHWKIFWPIPHQAVGKFGVVVACRPEKKVTVGVSCESSQRSLTLVPPDREAANGIAADDCSIIDERLTKILSQAVQYCTQFIHSEIVPK